MPTLTTDTAASIGYSAIDQVWIIAPGITTSGGVQSGFNGSTLLNYGRIFNAADIGASFGGPNVTVYNEAGAYIAGIRGVALSNVGNTLQNDGIIFGITQHGVHLGVAANNATINNSGSIFGKLGGVTVSAGFATNIHINNFAEISSDQHGIYLLNAAGAQPVIVNSGTIQGTVNSILAEAGDRFAVTNTGTLDGNVRATSANQSDNLANSGRVLGNVFLGSGNDVYSGAGTGSVSGTVFGEDGNDSITGGSAIDRFNGGNGNDALNGGIGNDSLIGGAGNDVLIGNLGRDIMAGGAHNDIFRFAARTHSPAATPDVITDFDDFGNDRIDLSALPGVLTYRHNLGFTGAGQVRINDIAGPDLLVLVNTGGSLAADFAIRLAGTTLGSMAGSDFML